MTRRFAKVSEEEIVAINEAAFFQPSDFVNTKTTIPLRVGEERWMYSWLARDVTGSLKRTVRHVGVQAANLHMSKCTCDSVF